MGLDIHVYKNLQVVENPNLDEGGHVIDYNNEWKPGPSMEWSEKHFPGRGEGLDPDTVYTFEDSTGFRAGSYIGYGWWRDELEKLAKEVGSGAFDELINFSDSEGVIGPVVSKKLAKDFADHEEAARQKDPGWFTLYLLWKQAFEMAAENGAVEFR